MDFEIFKLHHRGQDCLGVRLSREDSRNAQVRGIQGIKWSQTNRCWYGVVTELLMQQLAAIGGKPPEPAIQPTHNQPHPIFSIGESDVTLFTPNIEQLDALSLFKSHMKVIRYAENSIINYEKAVLKFLKYFRDCHWRDLTAAHIRDFQQTEIIDKNQSLAYQNLLINAIKLFYEVNTGIRPDTTFINRPRRSHYLPTILSREDLERLLRLVVNKKHKTMLSLCYACGLRSGELLGLKHEHIDRSRKTLMVRGAKGNKDRQLPLSDKIIAMIDDYLTFYTPETWIFEGQIKGQPYSMRSLQMVLKRALQVAKLSSKITLHCLRHTFATHLVESGVHILVVRDLLGHKSVRTTEIYTHVSHSMMNRLKNPFDDLNI